MIENYFITEYHKLLFILKNVRFLWVKSQERNRSKTYWKIPKNNRTSKLQTRRR